MMHPHLTRPWWLLPVGRLHPLWWSGVGVGLIWIDYVSGPSTPYPVAYVVPVSVAAWYSGRPPALVLAAAVPLAHVLFLVELWPNTGELALSIVTTMLRGAVIVVTALWVARLSEHERSLHRYVQRLEGLLPICSFCKSIRNDAGEWERLETFISTRSEAHFTHGMCPACEKANFSELDHHDVSRLV